MRDHFLKLFKYNEWANNRIFESVLRLDNIKENYIKALSHITGAQKLWYDRVKAEKFVNEVIKLDNIEGCITISKETSLNWLKFIENLDETSFKKVISYRDTKGNSHQNTLKDILTHLVNHSTYHRAQIVKFLKEDDGEIPVTDFIVYARNINLN